MKKEEKSALVAELADGLRRASLAVVSEYKGIRAGESDEMRRRLRAAHGEFRVAKNTLLQRALQNTSFAALESRLGGPIGLVISYADPVELAKALTSLRELGERFKIRGGVLDGKPLSAEEIAALATLPPREVVLAQLLGLLQAPAARLARVLNEPGSGLARLLDAMAKKQAESTPA